MVDAAPGLEAHRRLHRWGQGRRRAVLTACLSPPLCRFSLLLAHPCPLRPAARQRSIALSALHPARPQRALCRGPFPPRRGALRASSSPLSVRSLFCAACASCWPTELTGSACAHTANSVGFKQTKKCINTYKMHPAVCCPASCECAAFISPMPGRSCCPGTRNQLGGFCCPSLYGVFPPAGCAVGATRDTGGNFSHGETERQRAASYIQCSGVHAFGSMHRKHTLASCSACLIHHRRLLPP